MLLTRLAITVFPVGLMVLAATAVSGQTYPNKPIRIVTSDPGGSTDFASRLIAQGLKESLGQQVVVDNRGNTGTEIMSKALPDGYTVLVEGASFWIGPLLQKLPYDPVRDFLPVTTVTLTSGILVVHPSVNANSVKELIALAKANPGELNYASSVTGASNHLAAELFKAMASVNIVRVNYKGVGPALNGLVSGEVQMMCVNPSSAAPHLKSGRLRALAVTSAQPSTLFPALPTVAAAGVPGYEAVSLTGMFAPPKTPAVIISRINQETVRVLNRPDMKERFANSGVETAGSSPQQFAIMVKAEMAKWAKVLRNAGIRADY